MDSPLVSVIVPVFNRERLLHDALTSILDQDYRPLDVIVVDDGSTDRSAEVARSFPGVRCLRQSNQGVSVARNAGITASRGEFLAFLDSDDVWLPGKLRLQIDEHRRRPELGATFTMMRQELLPGYTRPAWLKPQLLAGDQIGFCLPTMNVRRDVMEKVGLFDEKMWTSEDCDWLVRLRDTRVLTAVLPQVLLVRRIHDDHLSAQCQLRDLMGIFKASLVRKRA